MLPRYSSIMFRLIWATYQVIKVLLYVPGSSPIPRYVAKSIPTLRVIRATKDSTRARRASAYPTSKVTSHTHVPSQYRVKSASAGRPSLARSSHEGELGPRSRDGGTDSGRLGRRTYTSKVDFIPRCPPPLGCFDINNFGCLITPYMLTMAVSLAMR